MAKGPLRIRDAAGQAFRKLVLWTSADEADVAASPTLTSGAGAPSASLAQGSVYLRADGASAAEVAYVATDNAGTWTALANTAVATQVATSGGESYVLDIEASATGEALVKMADNLASAFEIKEAANSYLKFVTTNAAERILAGVPLKFAAGLSSALDLTAVATGEALVSLKDNLASAFEIKEASASYLKFVTTNDAERVVAGKVVAFAAPTVVAMADAACALVYGTAGAGEVKLTSNIALVDPDSGEASEILTLPPVATSTGVQITIINTGGEGIVVKDVATNTIITLDTAQHGLVVCDGTNWFGFMGAIT